MSLERVIWNQFQTGTEKSQKKWKKWVFNRFWQVPTKSGPKTDTRFSVRGWEKGPKMTLFWTPWKWPLFGQNGSKNDPIYVNVCTGMVDKWPIYMNMVFKTGKNWKKVIKSDKNGVLSCFVKKVDPLFDMKIVAVPLETCFFRTEKRVILGPHFWPKITHFWSISGTIWTEKATISWKTPVFEKKVKKSEKGGYQMTHPLQLFENP